MYRYDDWKRAGLRPQSLFLDPRNPRIPDVGRPLSGRELIEDLLENDKVYELAKSIVEKGYFPGEPLIVVEEEGRKYVLEGNRRLAALKLLSNPECAPDGWRKRIHRLSRNFQPDTMKKVEVLVVPSREDAAPLIITRHTTEAIQGWTTLMQARSYENLLRNGASVDEVSAQYKIPASEVVAAVRMCEMYHAVCQLDLPDALRRKVHNPRQFPITTLKRLYDNPEVLRFLGISFDSIGRLVGEVDPAEFKKGLAKILTDMEDPDKEKRLDSRRIDTTKQMEEYLDGFGSEKPDLTKKGSFTAQSLANKAAAGPLPDGPLPSKPVAPRQPRISTRLIPRTLGCNAKSPRVRGMFGEGRSLDTVDFPNSSALLLRTFLELSLADYLKRNGQLQPIIDEEKARRKALRGKAVRDTGVGPRWTPGLRMMLEFSTRDSTGIVADPKLRAALRKLQKDSNLLSIDTMNQYVHNEFFQPTHPVLRDLWNQLQPLFEILLD